MSDNSFATVGAWNSSLSSQLMNVLSQDDLVPGSEPSYQACKTIYSYHPLGAKMAEVPIELAQSQKRLLDAPGYIEDELIEAFEKESARLGSVGVDRLVGQVMILSRVYGIASIAAMIPNKDASTPLDEEVILSKDLRFNILDPLNTSGSLILDQDPNSFNYQKPGCVSVNGVSYHASRTCVMLNEQPLYIEWSNSAFGFVGRSVYQRAFYPLKSFLLSMITDNMIMEKAGLIVAKLEQPGSIIDNIAQKFFGIKRTQIKGAKVYNVLSIGKDENIESLDLTNLRDAAEFARTNILKNIASACKMPATLLNQETLTQGFGEGSEDAKQIARYIDSVRAEMDPLYRWLDNIVMHRAWDRNFFAAMQNKYDFLRGKEYETVFYEWKNAFKAKWPNLLAEPDSEKSKVFENVTKTVLSAFSILSPQMDQENKARLAGWVADQLNNQEFTNTVPLDIDLEAMAQFSPPAGPVEEEPNVKPFSSEM